MRRWVKFKKIVIVLKKMRRWAKLKKLSVKSLILSQLYKYFVLLRCVLGHLRGFIFQTIFRGLRSQTPAVRQPSARHAARASLAKFTKRALGTLRVPRSQGP